MATTLTRLGDSLKTNNAGVVFARNPALGPAAALLIAIVFFSIATNTFFNIDNFSAVINQTTVIGTLALGQTLIILTAGIDLANAAIAVFGTMLITQLVSGGLPSPIGLTAGIVACGAIAMVSGLLVTQLRLPPFIVTLGMLAVMTAVTNLYSGGTTHPVPEGLLTWLGTQTYLFGGIPMTYGMGVTAILFAITWAALAKTAWGRHVYGGESVRWATASGRRRACRDVRQDAGDHGRTDRCARRQGN